MLGEHHKDINAIAKNIAKGMKSDLKYGLITNLEVTLTHMDRARKELKKAQKELSLI
jgi:hypothetical protein